MCLFSDTGYIPAHTYISFVENISPGKFLGEINFFVIQKTTGKFFEFYFVLIYLKKLNIYMYMLKYSKNKNEFLNSNC